MKSKLLIFTLIASLLASITVLSHSVGMLVVYILLITVYSAIDVKLGLFALCVIFPLSSSFGGIFFVAPMIFFVFIAKSILEGKLKIYKGRFFIYPFLISILSLLASVISGYTEFVFLIINFLIVVVFSSIIYVFIRNDIENLYLIGTSFIVAGCIGFNAAFENSEGGRLALEESVRTLSNVVGLAILSLLLLCFYLPRPQKNKQIVFMYDVIYKLRFLFLLILIYGLISTMSRGTSISILVITIIFIANYYYNQIRKFNIFKFFKAVIGICIVFYLLVYFNTKLIAKTGIDTERIQERLTSEQVEGGVNIREKIWKAGISSMSDWELIYGYGYVSFRHLAMKKGYDYYAHSVFIDTLVTSGILGFSILFLLFWDIFVRIYRYKNIPALLFVVFVILNFMTHGRMMSPLFWIVLAVATALSYKSNFELKRRI